MCTSMLSSVDTVAAAESHVENDRLGDELKGNKIKLSLANCGVCGSEVANYRCPGCLKHSCSLPCVKKHKEESGCSGVRDKTAFVALSKMDEMNLLSDYRFLEDTGRLADSANRDSLVRGPPVNFRAKRLTAQARRLNITLRFLPNTFTKSRENSTICLKKENRFLWHLQLLFPQSSSEFTERRVSDDQTLKQILTPYIHPTESEPVRRQKYQELDVAKTLKENLKFKLVIEYPLLHIVLKDHCHDYPLKGPVEPVLAHGSPMMEGAWRGNGRREEGRTEVSQPQLGPPFLGSSPETDPPKKKRAKREPEELEDGEIGDGDDDIEADKMVKEIVAHGDDNGDDEMPIDGFHGDCQVDDNPNYGNNHVDTHSGGCCIGDAMIAATETVDDKIRGDPESKAMSQNLQSVNLLSHFPVNNNDSINIDHGANGNDTGFDVSKK
uniref:Box C/D snoRNA protein 1 n=1 Tax=Oncorhynchus kisutch TaxID=8019 RepID=A0A8C7FXB3_ONCKI